MRQLWCNKNTVLLVLSKPFIILVFALMLIVFNVCHLQRTFSLLCDLPLINCSTFQIKNPNCCYKTNIEPLEKSSFFGGAQQIALGHLYCVVNLCITLGKSGNKVEMCVVTGDIQDVQL